MTHLVAFASNLHGRISVAGDGSECEIVDQDLCRFISTRAGVVEKQQEGVIASSVCGVLIW